MAAGRGRVANFCDVKSHGCTDASKEATLLPAIAHSNNNNIVSPPLRHPYFCPCCCQRTLQTAQPLTQVSSPYYQIKGELKRRMMRLVTDWPRTRHNTEARNFRRGCQIHSKPLSYSLILSLRFVSSCIPSGLWLLGHMNFRTRGYIKPRIPRAGSAFSLTMRE